MKITERVVMPKPLKQPVAEGGPRLVGTVKAALGTMMCAYNSEVAAVAVTPRLVAPGR
ncbi:MAG: hypothetical protein K6T75_10765 [Acetobacteraceae bacterium]|nr:hypothetical protein [Acetobacteraceae bacterium]